MNIVLFPAVHHLETPVTTDHLKIHIQTTHGIDHIRISEVRAYA